MGAHCCCLGTTCKHLRQKLHPLAKFGTHWYLSMLHSFPRTIVLYNRSWHEKQVVERTYLTEHYTLRRKQKVICGSCLVEQSWVKRPWMYAGERVKMHRQMSWCLGTCTPRPLLFPS